MATRLHRRYVGVSFKINQQIKIYFYFSTRCLPIVAARRVRNSRMPWSMCECSRMCSPHFCIYSAITGT